MTKIPLAAVLGSPVSHSKSPALFQHWLRRYDISGAYIPIDANPDDLVEILRLMPKMGFVGVNVTTPHKQAVLEIADFISDRAATIGAANTLVLKSDGKILADNTDGYGFLQNLKQSAPKWQADQGPAAIFGAGGAARAVISALLEAKCPEIRLTNRTRARSDALRSEFGARITVVDWVKAGNAIDDAATVVNATTLGMVGKPEFRVPLDGLSRQAVVADLVYNPLRTDFLKVAGEMGCTVVDGLGMLLHQAVPGFERWFGIRPEVDEAARAVLLDGL